MDYAALESFNRVAAAGGFAQASRDTGQPKATLSRRVRQLEENLGVRLFERGARTLRLTDEGVALRRGTEGLLAEIAGLMQDIVSGSDKPRGVLRVSAPALFAHVAIGPISAEVRRLYPDLRLEISAEDRMVDLVREGYDAVIRINPRADEGLVGRCFLRDHHVMVATASLPRPGRIDAPPRLVPAVVVSAIPPAVTWKLAVDKESMDVHPNPVLVVTSFMMAREAVLAGAGAACLPLSMVAADLAAGRLVSWGALSGPNIELWVLHTSRRLVSPKVKAFVELLCTTFQTD